MVFLKKNCYNNVIKEIGVLVIMIKLLTVDDSSTIRRVYGNVLPRIFVDKIELLEAENGIEGLKVLKNNPDIQLIFLDINMPEMNGKEMLATLRKNKEYDKIRVVMVTTEAEKKTVIQMMKLGANGYIVKPFNIDAVSKSLTPILARMNIATK